jgi:hypothetical protein
MNSQGRRRELRTPLGFPDRPGPGLPRPAQEEELLAGTRVLPAGLSVRRSTINGNALGRPAAADRPGLTSPKASVVVCMHAAVCAD